MLSKEHHLIMKFTSFPSLVSKGSQKKNKEKKKLDKERKEGEWKIKKIVHNGRLRSSSGARENNPPNRPLPHGFILGRRTKNVRKQFLKVIHTARSTTDVSVSFACSSVFNAVDAAPPPDVIGAFRIVKQGGVIGGRYGQAVKHLIILSVCSFLKKKFCPRFLVVDVFLFAPCSSYLCPCFVFFSVISCPFVFPYILFTHSFFILPLFCFFSLPFSFVFSIFFSTHYTPYLLKLFTTHQPTCDGPIASQRHTFASRTNLFYLNRQRRMTCSALISWHHICPTRALVYTM